MTPTRRTTPSPTPPPAKRPKMRDPTATSPATEPFSGSQRPISPTSSSLNISSSFLPESESASAANGVELPVYREETGESNTYFYNWKKEETRETAVTAKKIPKPNNPDRGIWDFVNWTRDGTSEKAESATYQLLGAQGVKKVFTHWEKERDGGEKAERVVRVFPNKQTYMHSNWEKKDGVEQSEKVEMLDENNSSIAHFEHWTKNGSIISAKSRVAKFEGEDIVRKYIDFNQQTTRTADLLIVEKSPENILTIYKHFRVDPSNNDWAAYVFEKVENRFSIGHERRENEAQKVALIRYGINKSGFITFIQTNINIDFKKNLISTTICIEESKDGNNVYAYDNWSQENNDERTAKFGSQKIYENYFRTFQDEHINNFGIVIELLGINPEKEIITLGAITNAYDKWKDASNKSDEDTQRSELDTKVNNLINFLSGCSYKGIILQTMLLHRKMKTEVFKDFIESGK